MNESPRAADWNVTLPFSAIAVDFKIWNFWFFFFFHPHSCALTKVFKIHYFLLKSDPQFDVRTTGNRTADFHETIRIIWLFPASRVDLYLPQNTDGKSAQRRRVQGHHAAGLSVDLVAMATQARTGTARHLPSSTYTSPLCSCSPTLVLISFNNHCGCSGIRKEAKRRHHRVSRNILDEEMWNFETEISTFSSNSFAQSACRKQSNNFADTDTG